MDLYNILIKEMNDLKIRILKASLLATFLLSGCGAVGQQNQSESANAEISEENILLVDRSDVTENQWIDTKGEIQKNSEMVSVGPVGYMSDEKYLINKTAYISYFNEDKFLKTILYDYKNDFPIEIESVSEANEIYISFNKKNSDTIQLTKE